MQVSFGQRHSQFSSPTERRTLAILRQQDPVSAGDTVFSLCSAAGREASRELPDDPTKLVVARGLQRKRLDETRAALAHLQSGAGRQFPDREDLHDEALGKVLALEEAIHENPPGLIIDLAA